MYCVGVAGGPSRAVRILLVATASWTASLPALARAAAFNDYALAETFTLSPGASGLGVLADGRIVTIVGTDLYA